jgi:hypothetical protein
MDIRWFMNRSNQNVVDSAVSKLGLDSGIDVVIDLMLDDLLVDVLSDDCCSRMSNDDW